jgi:hypothetical protein
MNKVQKNRRSIIAMYISDFVNLILSEAYFFSLKKSKRGKAMLKTRKSLQSRGILKRLRKTARNGRTERPMPILIKFLSKKLSEFLRNLVRV